MGQFFKFLFASCLGVFLALTAIIFVGSLVFAQVAMQAEKPPKVSQNTVLHLTLNNPVPEKTNNVQMPIFDLKSKDILGLHDLMYTLETAQNDDNIKGVFLEVDIASLGMSSARSLRQSIMDFRNSGKFVIAHSNFYTQGAYYLVSAADSVYLNPGGMVDFRGLAVQIPFYKNMLDKVGVNMEIFYAGKFKSATEPYRRSEMSDGNRLQRREYLDQIYSRFLGDISQSRNIPVSELRQIADEFSGSSDKLSVETGLVDGLAYEDQVFDRIRNKLGLEEDEKIKLVSPEKYFLSKPPKKNYRIKDKIAVIYAEGTLMDGEEAAGVITEDHYIKMIRKIRKDEKIKAVVLRVNSGGGSAITSENILRELQLTKSEGKPIIVSMGDVAASGGYMIAAAGDSILAETNTITGSIGVFGMMPIAQKLLNDKLGINIDTISTGQMSSGLTPFYAFSEKERKIMQTRVEETYASFLSIVAESRGKTSEEIHEIAQGRVWTGPKAVEIGLVDRIGDLDDAIASAAKSAGLDSYRISEYPITKDPLQQLLDQVIDLEQTKMRQQKELLRSQLGEWYPHYEFIQEVSGTKTPQARLPFIISFE